MKTIKSIARILIFCLLLHLMFTGLNRILQQKDSVVRVKPFLESAQEYDVLFVGDSQVLNGIMPMELYHKYGIASYAFASENSLIPMTYWRILNALEYTTPKVVVLSVTDVDELPLTNGESEWMHVAFDAFPMTLTKAKAIFELTNQEGTDKSGATYDEVRTELFFPLRLYHSRWSSLKPEDFKPEYNTHKGYQALVHVSDPDVRFQLVDRNDCLPEEGEGFAYLRKIIEECQRRNIPLVLYQPPYPIWENEHLGTHTAANIAEEYGVPMLNFPDMNRVVDFYVDCADPGSHLNVSGAQKVTDFLGQYLTANYTLPDRREDSSYAHWDDAWDAEVEEKIRRIAEDADSLRSRLMLLHDDSFNVVLTVRSNFNYNHRNTRAALQNIAREHVYNDDTKISAEINPLEGLSYAIEEDVGYMLIVDRDAEDEYSRVQEFYGLSEREFETSFGYVFCRMDGEWIDLSITQDDEETYYFESWEEQDEDMRLILIDRRTGKPALTMAFSRTEEEQN